MRLIIFLFFAILLLKVSINLSAQNDTSILIKSDSSSNQMNIGITDVEILNINYLNHSELNTTPTYSLQEALQGKMPELIILRVDGAPGGRYNILANGFSKDATTPLYPFSLRFTKYNPYYFPNSNYSIAYIVDGNVNIEAPLIHPQSIEKVGILNHSEANLFGALSDNGIIGIQTKRGKSNKKLSIDFSTYQGITTIAKKLDVLNADEYANFYKQLYADSLERLPQDFNDSIRKLNGNIDTDWQDEVTQLGYISDYALGVSTNNKYMNLYIGGYYNSEKGHIIGTESNKYGLTLNSDYKIGNRIEIGESFSHYSISNSIHMQNLLNQAIISSPLEPAYNIIEPHEPNRIISLNYYMKEENINVFDSKYSQIFLNTYVKANINKNIFYKSSYSYQQYNNTPILSNLLPSSYSSSAPTYEVPLIPIKDPENKYFAFNNSFNYTLKENNHTFKTFIGYRLSNQKLKNFVYPSYSGDPSKNVMNVMPPEFYEYNEDAIISGIRYNFKNKYYFNCNLNSTKKEWVSEDTKKWQPTGSASGIIKIISNKTSSKLNLFQLQSGYTRNSSYLANFKSHFNIGFDLNLFNNKLNTSINYYQNETELNNINIYESYTNKSLYSAYKNYGISTKFSLKNNYENFSYHISWNLNWNLNLKESYSSTMIPGGMSGRLGDPDIEVSYSELSTAPRYYGGMQGKIIVKQFDAALSILGMYKYVNRQVPYTIENIRNFNNLRTEEKEYWENEINNGINIQNYSGYPFVAEALVNIVSFTRIQDLQIGYNIKSQICEKVKVSCLRIYFSGKNLYTFTNYKGYDPEIITPYFSPYFYPLPKTYIFGIQMEI